MRPHHDSCPTAPTAPPVRRGRCHRGSGGPDATWPSPPSTDEAEASRLIALVELARKGDTEAFGLLYDHYQPLGLPLPLLPPRLRRRRGGPHLGDVLPGAAQHDSFRWQGKDFGAWLMTIARNLTTDHYKSSRTRLEITTEDMSPHDSATEGAGGRRAGAPG